MCVCEGGGCVCGRGHCYCHDDIVHVLLVFGNSKTHTHTHTHTPFLPCITICVAPSPHHTHTPFLPCIAICVPPNPPPPHKTPSLPPMHRCLQRKAASTASLVAFPQGCSHSSIHGGERNGHWAGDGQLLPTDTWHCTGVGLIWGLLRKGMWGEG